MDSIKLVMLPGLDGTGVLFRPLLKALPANIEPIVVDYPADKPLGYEDLLPIVLSALPRKSPFILLGESFGGPLSLRVAATHPAGLCGLILCATFISCPQRFVPTWAAPLVHPFPFRAIPQVAQIKALLGGYGSPYVFSLSREAMSLVSPQVLAHRIREVIKINVTAELAACELPILYLQGKHDFVVPSANFKRILRIKSTVQRIQIASPHMLLQTQPEAAAEAIGRFVTHNAGV